MAQMVSVRLNKGEAPSLGFRIQGGKDFGTPLIIQKVNFGSPAEKAGLQAGDSVIKINNVDVYSLRHKDAQDIIIRAGPAFEITVQRGGSTWKPTVTPTASTLPKPQPASNSYSPVTKTSLAVNPQPSIGAIGTGHNVSAKPFNAQVNGTVNGAPKFVNKQYNTPLGLYSEQSIAETLSAQAEVLSTGVLGVNFKKNEKDYDASNSEVFRMVQEADKEPRHPEAEPESGVVTAPLSSVIGLRHVIAPETKPTPPTPQLPPGQNICADCERLVTGVFVRIKDKNLHVECFKCATCGTSLKNVGYYNINNKLYCDIHAKLAARSNPPAPNLAPVTIPPGGRVPAGTISAALSSHPLSSSAAPVSPSTNPNQTAQPFQQSLDVTDEPPATASIMSTSANASEISEHDFTNGHIVNEESKYVAEKPVAPILGSLPKYNPFKNEGPISFSAYMSKSGTNFSSPRPFSSVAAPLSPPTNTGYSTFPKASPVSAPYSSPAPSVPTSERGRSLQNIIWPPPPDPEESDVPTATPLYFAPPSQLRTPTPPCRPLEPEIIQPPLPKSPYSFQPRTPISFKEENVVKTTEEIVYKEETLREETTTYSESVLTEEEEEFLEAEDISMEPRMSLCSAEVTSIVDRKVAVEKIESAAETQMLVESVIKQRPRSPPPVPGINEDILPKVEVQTQPLRPRSNTEPRVVTRVCVCTNSCCNANTGELCESCPMRDFKRPNDFQKRKVIPIQNTVPKRFGSPIITGVSVTINNPGKIKDSPKDFFTEIPVKKTTTALGSALMTAPKQPFQAVATNLEAISLPEETQPYLPPERPYVPPPKPERKESLPQPDSQFISALRIAPDRPWTPTNPPPLVTKKKSADDPIMKDLPKPKQWMSMISALTTASDRPYSPFVGEVTSTTQQVVEQTEIQQEEIIKMKKSQQEIMKRSTHNETALPKPFVGTTTKATRLEKFDALNDDRVTPQMNFPPVSDELKASYEYHADYSEIKSEISSQIIEQAHLEETSEVSQKTQQKKQEVVQCSSCQKAITKEEKKIEKQTEETILKKPMELTSQLQKREYIPQYQMSLNYDETIELPHHKNIKKLLPNDQGKQDTKNVNPKPSSYQYTPKPLPTYREPQIVTKPVATIQPGQANPNISAMSFQAIDDERPPKTTFSPRPGSLTPSMINKPPSTLPYYQANLVYTEMAVPEINIFDPKSPAISRSPSPCPERAPSPFGRMSPRPKSPAAGPPPNPLKQGVIPKFTKEDHMKSEAAKNISSYIPQYREKIDGRVSDFDSRTVTQHVSFDVPITKTTAQEAACMKKSAYQTQGKSEDCSASCSIKLARGSGKTVSENIQASSQQVMQVPQSLQQSVQQTVQGIVEESVQQVQQQRSMQQSFRQQSSMQQASSTQQSSMVQKSCSKQQSSASQQSSSKQQSSSIQQSAIAQQASAKQTSLEATKQTLKPSTEHPFRQVKNPEVEPPGVQGMRITNPQRLNSPFFPKSQTQSIPAQQPPAPPARSSISKIPISAATAQPKPIQTPKDVLTNKNSLCGASANVSNVPKPNAGVGGGKQAGAVGFSPKRGRGVLNVGGLVGSRVAVCGHCHSQIRGPFITALGKIWCPDHFVCTTQNCRRPLADIGFIEEQGQLYCEFCFEQYLAPPCAKCGIKVKGDCLKAIGKNFHPECFNCSYCGKLFGNSPFFLEDGQPYCENDWNEMFTTKCFACGFPVEAGDRWVEALNNNYHSQCFNCTMCKKNLEGQSFFAKGGRPFCKNHAR